MQPIIPDHPVLGRFDPITLEPRNPLVPPAAAQPQYQPPPDTYIPRFDNAHRRGHRTVESRRRVWSQFALYIHPNINPHSNEEDFVLGYMLRFAIDNIFQNPAALRRIMMSVNVAPGRMRRNSAQVVHEAGLFADNGDQFDATHVFAHEYSRTVESGEILNRPHVNIDYQVLHDSAFHINREALQYEFRNQFNRLYRYYGLQDTGMASWIRGSATSSGVFVRITNAMTKYPTEEYQKKNEIGVHGRWSRRPAGVNSGARGATRSDVLH